MRFRTYQLGGALRVVARRADAWVDLSTARPAVPPTLKEIIADWPALRPKVESALAHGPAFNAAGAKLLPPIPDPQKVICVGLNYADHAHETGKDPPPEPVIFNKFVTALCAHDADVALPRVSSQVDYEAELVAVIGKGGRDIRHHDAMAHVAGYTCGNDVSARDWQTQKPGRQWLLGKSFDTFGPCGPDLVTSDEMADAGNLAIRLRLNGETLQDSRTDQLIFSVPELVAYVSQVCTLATGDLIFTGTPSGVGMARTPPRFLKAGDIMEVEIEKLGTLRNRVVSY